MSLGLVKKLLGQRRRTGQIAPLGHRGGRPPKIRKTHLRRLRALVRKQPDLTLEQLRAAAGLACSLVAMTIEGATDTLVLREYVRHVLRPGLRPGDVVVMDNLMPHKSTETLALIEAAGASVRFLPAYSPDLNPIEKMWSKVKNSLRAAEARTLPDLERAVAAALHSVTAQDAAGWFQSCGYTQK